MFCGFNLDIHKGIYPFDSDHFPDYCSKGKSLFEHTKKEVQQSLAHYLSPDGVLLAQKLEENWFPHVNADVFISHSHRDIDIVTALAGWLYEEFQIMSFVDYWVWGYADTLLRKIDDIYCLNDDYDSYSYFKRNLSTAHIHMILNIALTKMIDDTECMFFVNTPNSILLSDTFDDYHSDVTTASPWIYSELMLSKVLRRKKPERFLQHGTTLAESRSDGLLIQYNVDIRHLLGLNLSDLLKWNLYFRCKSSERKWSDTSSLYLPEALDVLYRMKGLIK